MSFEAQGRLRNIETLGPPNADVWTESYVCLEGGFRMFDVVDLGNILNYKTHVLDYVARYGPALWYLIYQADHRMRLEGMERLRRRGEAEHSAAVEAGGKHPFDPERPWNWVWQQAVLDVIFWKKEIEEPALLILSRTQSTPIQDAAEKWGTGVELSDQRMRNRDTEIKPTR